MLSLNPIANSAMTVSEEVRKTMAARPTAADPIARTLERKIRLNLWWLAIEGLWPRLWLPLAVVLVFLLATLLGVWPLLTRQQHIAGLAASGLILLLSLLPALRLPWPTRADALARLERLSGVPHRPASTYTDTVDERGHLDGESGELWTAHKRRMAEQVDRLQVKPPVPRVERHDPFAARAALILALSVAALVSGDTLRDRLASAFFWAAGKSVASTARLDAWLTPPSYTGQQPILLADGGKLAVAAGGEQPAISVPEGTVLVVRGTGEGSDRLAVTFTTAGGSAVALQPASAGGPAAASGSSTAAPPTRAVAEFQMPLTASGSVGVQGMAGRERTWSFLVVPDKAPEIVLTKDPVSGARGKLVLTYKVTDDYGVAGADGALALKAQVETKRLTLADGTVLGAMGEPPEFQLKLPKSASRKEIAGKTQSDLAAHPWAGARATLSLTARDQAGRIGRSAPVDITMPSRAFRQPLARAIVEQRRILATSPGRFRQVQDALDALTIAPDKFIPDTSIYLGLRSAYHRLGLTPTAESLRSVVDQLWDIALQVEDGNLSDAQRRLRDSQEDLAKALENGASDEEIKALMEQLKQAMADYMKQLAEQAQRNPEQMAQPQPGDQEMQSRDLDEMLKQIEKLSQSGAKDAARQMLSELQDMMERMQAGQQPGQQGQQGQQNRQMMDQFGKMITKQRKLLDETFKSQRGRQPGQGEGEDGEDEGESGEGKGRSDKGKDGRGFAEQMEGLGRQQGDLRKELKRMLDELKARGGSADGALDKAGEEMQRAEEALGDQNPESAAERQGRALDQLRKGAQQMTEQMMRGRRDGQADGDRGNNGDRDPLGRQYSNDNPETDGAATKVPRDIDTQRARRILEELRRRLGESTRPTGELDYIERLLRSN